MNQTNPNRADGALSNDMPEAVHADGMRILWDVPIPMSDGVVLRADVFPVSYTHLTLPTILLV